MVSAPSGGKVAGALATRPSKNRTFCLPFGDCCSPSDRSSLFGQAPKRGESAMAKHILSSGACTFIGDLR